MPLTLDDILSAPSDPEELNKHLIGRGLIPPIVAAPPPIAPATVGALSPVAPAVKPMVPPVAPTGKESIAAGIAVRPKLSAKEEGKRQFQELRPQLTADPGSV